MKKKDFIFGFLLVMIFMIIFLIIRNGEKGTFVRVSVDGEYFGNYMLTEKEQIVNINDTNILTIMNNEAYMSYAECPDKLCVNKGKVSKEGEDIICMPNRIVISVEGGEADEE